MTEDNTGTTGYLVDGSSGTVVSPSDWANVSESSLENSNKPRAEGDEETLESHEVIELQSFIERKAWIEEKIKLLEKMPPIEVFVGLDAVQASAEQVPGLPTREELKQWLVEHDALEKELEIFDTGELKKLRKFTRAATQRNLSPEDTDLIELTLTTIYALDKLLHLLRDRSENLDLISVRLSWEEHRIASWIDRRKIITDLQSFLQSRVQWSASVYENPPVADERRGSIGSIASASSDTSINSSAFSRSSRFKLAEFLSRDAAAFSARVSSLRHGSVAASGKLLDKLIDNSRKPVPEVLLDEQDKLEEKCVNDMENIGKFVLNVVMQWRKADEIYVETKKDLFGAQALIEEIETANTQHPTARQSSAFITRTETLLKRLQLRGNPASPSSIFPRPTHALFTQQSDFNEALVQTLSSEIQSTTDLTRRVESMAKKYKACYDAVHRMETLNEAVISLTATFESIVDRLENGISSSEGDGTPPSLMSNNCLDPTSHSVFLALLPSLTNELAKVDKSASELVRQVPAALLHLDFPGIDQEFKTNVSAQLLCLTRLREQAQRLSDDMAGRVGRLRGARKLWATMDTILKDLEGIRRDTVDEMDNCRWRQDNTSVSEAPPTPESLPSIPLPNHTSQQHSDLQSQFDQLGARLENDVNIPLASLSALLEVPLKGFLSQSFQNLKSHFTRVRRLIDLLQSLHTQTLAMNSVREEFNALQLRIDEIMIRYESKIEEILNDLPAEDDVEESDKAMNDDYTSARIEAMAFVNGLSQRVPLVTSSQGRFLRRSFSSINLTSAMTTSDLPIELPFDLHAVDDTVRADCNSYSMRLNGQAHSLEQKLDHYHLSHIAKRLDVSTSTMLNEIGQAAQQTSTFKESLGNITSGSNVSEFLAKLASDITQSSSTHRSRLNRSLSLIREMWRHLESAPGAQDNSMQDSVVLPRARAIGDLEAQFASWEAGIDSLRAQVVTAREAEDVRLKREQEAEEARLAAERDRLAQEEAERARVEKERIEEEERRKIEEIRLAEEARLRQEEEEKARMEKEKHEEAERIRLNELRLAEEARVKAEQEKFALEEAEKTRLEKDRAEIAMKLKETEGILLAERQLHAEKDRLASEEAEKARLEREKLNKERNQAVKELEAANLSLEEDVFGVRVTPADGPSITQETKDVLAVMARLRKRLRSIGINEAARPQSSSSDLPPENRAKAMRQELLALKQESATLPDRVEVVSVNVQLQSLKNDVEASLTLMDRVESLAALHDALVACDGSLSDLLEHIDSFPAEPLGPLSSSYTSPPNLIPAEQLKDRLSFTRSTVDAATTAFEPVKDDPRAVAEHDRIIQTWSELEEMCNDRVNGKKSRPNSAMSSISSHSSHSSVLTTKTQLQPQAGPSSRSRKTNGYATLSVASSKPKSRLHIPSPSLSASRRTFSGSDEPSTSHSTGRMSSMSTRSSQQRATSGGNLYGTTYASRQRTTSLTTSTATPLPKRNVSGGHTRAQTTSASQKKPDPSSSLSDASLSLSRSSWSRAPRISFPGVPRVATPPKRPPQPRKTYIPNPKSKLDVAVGDVVNNLPIGINIEGVSGSWKDQSGKYWIGDQDPKLCFCRILRSQTVMVRVGGGWAELSKFIRDHFADSFRLLATSDSPGMHATGEERWISSATLLEERNTPPGPPKTPEPRGILPLLPSFSLSTPSGRSPRSLGSTPSTKGSPLTPLRFMRRAEPEAPFLARPETPTKTPHRMRTNTAHTPARQSIWRP